MPRKPRIEYAGAMYHVMSRGDHGEEIFRDNADREQFLECLGEVCGRTGWKIHSYVLMTNHYHLLTETPVGNLISGMRWLQGTYTIRYNVRHKLHGHLFQGRYKTNILDPEEDRCALKVSTYIHLNPLRAGLVKGDRPRLETYRWSSLPLFLTKPTKRPAWLSVQRVMGGLGIEDTSGGRRKYADYMREYVMDWLESKGRKRQEEEWADIRRGWCMGGKDFRNRLIGRLDGIIGDDEQQSYAGDEKVEYGIERAEWLIRMALIELGRTESELAESSKAGLEKCGLAWLVRSRTSVGVEWVASRLNMGHRTNVAHGVRRIREGSDAEARTIRAKLEPVLQITD